MLARRVSNRSDIKRRLQPRDPTARVCHAQPEWPWCRKTHRNAPPFFVQNEVPIATHQDGRIL